MNSSDLFSGKVPKEFCIIFMISYLIQLLIIVVICIVIGLAIFNKKYELATTLTFILPAYLYTYIRDRVLYFLCKNTPGIH
jgi:hypothetical protein